MLNNCPNPINNKNKLQLLILIVRKYQKSSNYLWFPREQPSDNL